MTRPLRLLILICLMASPAETRASATLRWMTGDLNMAWVSAGLCTLGVQSPSGLPGEWRLVWRSDVPIELVRPDPTTSPAGYTRVCAFSDPTSAADQLTNLYQTRHCAAAISGGSAAYYVFWCPAGAHARFGLYQLSEDSVFTFAGEATLNGGFRGALPCIVQAVQLSWNTDTLVVKVRGANLATVAEARLVGARVRPTAELQLTSLTPERLEARGIFADGQYPLRLELLAADGAIHAVDLPLVVPPPMFTDRLIVRFRPGVVTAPHNQHALNLTSIAMPTGLRDSLEKSGVVSMRRQFPDFDQDAAAGLPGTYPRPDPGLADVYVLRIQTGVDVQRTADVISHMELPRFGGRLRTAVDRELRGALFRLASPRPRTHAGA